jgi:hypothetical protein
MEHQRTTQQRSPLSRLALDIVRRPKSTPIHELEPYMRCKECSQVRGYPYKRSHLVADNKDFGERPALDLVAGRAMIVDGGWKVHLAPRSDNNCSSLADP